MSTFPADTEYLSAAQVKTRFGGVSDMWLHRRLKEHGFPKPTTFGTLARYWRVSELVAWEAAMRDRALNATKPKPPRR
jgi:predicted DNA-binding transcriptional regulator AlpA